MAHYLHDDNNNRVEGYATITTNVLGKSYISFNNLNISVNTGNIATFEIEINNVSYVSE